MGNYRNAPFKLKGSIKDRQVIDKFNYIVLVKIPITQKKAFIDF